MSGRTIAGTYTTGVSLTNPGDNPVTILSSANIAIASGVALPAASGTYWDVSSAGKITGYSAGVSFAGSGSLVNTGGIYASQTGSPPGYSYNNTTKTFIPLSGGVLLAGGGVSNASGAVIAGVFEGVAIGSGGSVVNAGSIHTGTAGFGIVLTAAGNVSNAATGSITAGRYGVLAFGTIAATVTNQGLIAGQKAVGVELDGGGTVVNAAGTITGATNGVITAGSITSTVTNQALIAGQATAGVVLSAGGTLTNATSGSITGGLYGVKAAGIASTVSNQGRITGGSRGVLLLDGGYVSNAGSGTIAGNYFGVRIINASGSVNNLGSVSSSANFNYASTFDAAGVDLAAGGTVTNGSSGNIRATWKGVEIGSGATSVGGTVFNQGMIYASNSAGSTGAAVWIHGPGLISNASTGTIGGGPFGIVAYFQTTVVNFGTITGTEFAVDEFAGFADRVIDGPGAVFVGTVTGGNSIGSSISSTLELASSSQQGTITGLGSQFIDFANVAIDPGAAWTFAAGNSLAAGVTLSDAGTLLLNGNTLTGAGTATISGSPGNFANATVSGSGLWTGAAALVVGDQGNGSLIVSSQGTVVTHGNISIDPSQGLDIALSAGGGGDVTVTGSKSLLSNAGRFVVGDAGLGRLLIEAGGTVVTTQGTVSGAAGAVIAGQAGSDGSAVSVTGVGSDWQVAGLLTVGKAAAGSLAITAGGTVTAGQVDAGATAGASGIVSVIGTGSNLTMTGQLTIGDSASAELSILSGAMVAANNADIGLNAGSTGNVDIEGAGSHLDIANDLNIGDAGVGVLTLGNGTELTVGNNLVVGANGVLNQFGGSIDPSTITIVSGGRQGGHGTSTASVMISNAGTLFASGGTETVITPLITAPSGKSGVLEVDAGGDMLLNVTSVDATQSVSFTDGTGILTIGTIGGFSASIVTVNPGDQIIVQGKSIASDSFNASSHVLTLFDGSSATIGTLQLGPSVDGSAILANGTGGLGVAPCFAAGTRISTERGEVAVEDLRVGDRVQIVPRHPHASPLPLRGRGGAVIAVEGPLLPLRQSGGGLRWGSAQPITWIGHRTVDCTRHPKPHQVHPVRISAHAFGPNRPCRDLYLSPDHALYINDVLIPVKHLINGNSIAQVARNEVSYYHIELPAHEVLLAENLPAESYLDTGDRANFANGPGPVALHPDFASRRWEAEGCAPLVVAGPEVATARRWLNAMADQARLAAACA